MVIMCQICSAFTACQKDRKEGTVLTSVISLIFHFLVKTEKTAENMLMVIAPLWKHVVMRLFEGDMFSRGCFI